ncbi:MAG: ankyrin repeat domain-containing protein [Pyrinomonadaceae bacterium]
MSKKSFIDSVRVGSPCNEKWEQMTGNERVRFCSHCAKSVNDLSTMTRKEATRFVRASGGQICIRYIVDPVTRRPVFAGQLLQITRRAPALATGVVTASMAISTAGYAQSSDPTPANAPAVNVFKDRVIPVSKPAEGTGRITGTVTDPNGAVVPGTKVSIVNSEGLILKTTTSNDVGNYDFVDVAAGTYTLRFESPGFRVNERRELTLSNAQIQADAQLDIGIAVTVDVVMELSSMTSTVGVMAMVVEYKSPLSQAVADEDKSLIRDAIAKGADPNARETSDSKITPMFLAVETGDPEIVQMLLDAGAKVNIRSTSKETPLMRLDSDGTRSLVELLIRNGAKVNVADEDGNTPLIHAAENSTSDAIAALIEAGADVNAANSDGETALIKAADRGDIQTVRALLFAGARVNDRDKDGDNAWDKTSDHEIESLLVSFGSEIREPDPADAPPPTPEPTPPMR